MSKQKISTSFIQRLILASSLVFLQSFYMKAESFPNFTVKQHLQNIVGEIEIRVSQLRDIWNARCDRLPF